jgi:peptidyl-prolyl cis-trans isomerase A (cyclophilin A)
MVRPLATLLGPIAALAWLSGASGPAVAQTPAASPLPAGTAPATMLPVKPVPRTVPVMLTTSAGPITLSLEVERAPVTAANFLRYVDERRLDGTSFYRGFTFPTRPDIGLIQGGTRNAPKRLLKAIAHEPTSKTGLTHSDGAISMARGAPGTATGDFFIIIGELPSLDADPKASGDNQGFAVFGRVTAGMDVVRTIALAPRSATAGEGAMKGQMLEQAVKIITARRVK